MYGAGIIDGNAESKELYVLIKQKIQILNSINITPTLSIILVGDDVASHIYVKNKIKQAQNLGIKTLPYFLPTETTEARLLTLIDSLNQNKDVNGILVQVPLPQNINSNIVINSIDYQKDVDGLTAYNIGLLNSWQECIEPSTPKGILILLKKYLGSDLSGKKAAIIGRSLIVGRSMATILTRENCSVILLHSRSKDIKKETSTADILICAIGSPHFINEEFVKEGACVIDVGISRRGGKILGDVDFDRVRKKAGFITPVPGGVGPMTVACMLDNTAEACFKQYNLNLL